MYLVLLLEYITDLTILPLSEDVNLFQEEQYIYTSY